MDKTIDTVIDEKLGADSEFQKSLESLSDEEKTSSIESKRKELLESEFKSLNERALKATKAEELANNFKARAEKVEERLKKYEKIDVQAPDGNNLSTKDLYSLMENKIPQEDVEDVVEYAAFKKISVAEALKSSVVKATLAEKAEFRRTSDASTTRSTRPAQTKPDGGKILEKARSGKGENDLPEPGSEEAEELFKARFEKRTGRVAS